MPHVLIAVSGSDKWTLADGTQHSCGFWPEEVAVPHEVFTKAGFDITLATPGAVTPVADEAGFTPEMNGDNAEPGQRFRAYLDRMADELAHPADLDAVSSDAFDLVFVPGGHGPMEDLAVSESFGQLVAAFTTQGKPVAAVCHGPAALLPARDGDGQWLFAGRRVTGFTNEEEGQVGLAESAPWLLEDRLAESGGTFESSGAPWVAHVTLDGNLFTGQNPASSQPLAELLVSVTASTSV